MRYAPIATDQCDLYLRHASYTYIAQQQRLPQPEASGNVQEEMTTTINR